MNEVVVGIDIGSSKVCTILGELNKNNQLQILGVGTAECKGLKKGIIIDIDDSAKAVRNSIEQAERMSGMEIKSAFINIAGGQTTLIGNKGVIAVSGNDREITAEDVERVMQEVSVVNIPIDREVIGVIPLQFMVDGYENIKDPIGMIGVRLEVHASVITAASASIQNLIRSVERCGVTVAGIIIDPLASSEVILTKDEKELGVVLVDVGGETTDISIFKGVNLIYTKLVPIGGTYITNDISFGLKIPGAEAEMLKRQYGYAAVKLLKSVEDIPVSSTGIGQDRKVTNQELTDIIEARVQEICYLVNKELETSGLKNTISGGIVITGGGLSFIKGSVETACSIFGKPVRVGAPHFIGVASPVYSTATGIVKYVLSSEKAGIKSKYTFDDENKVKSAIIKKHTSDKNRKVVGKIKDFFTDFF